MTFCHYFHFDPDILNLEIWHREIGRSHHFFIFRIHFQADFLSENTEHRLEQTNYFHQRQIYWRLIIDQNMFLVKSCMLLYISHSKRVKKDFKKCKFLTSFTEMASLLHDDIYFHCMSVNETNSNSLQNVVYITYSKK